MVMDSWPVETESAKRVRLRMMEKVKRNKIATDLQVIAIKVNNMASDSTLSWQESKALNIMYKELKTSALLLRAMAGEFGKRELSTMPLDIAQPQSYKVYLSKGMK